VIEMSFLAKVFCQQNMHNISAWRNSIVKILSYNATNESDYKEAKKTSIFIKWLKPLKITVFNKCL
jgi:hypothetical protein